MQWLGCGPTPRLITTRKPNDQVAVLPGLTPKIRRSNGILPILMMESRSGGRVVICHRNELPVRTVAHSHVALRGLNPPAIPASCCYHYSVGRPARLWDRSTMKLEMIAAPQPASQLVVVSRSPHKLHQPTGLWRLGRASCGARLCKTTCLLWIKQ